MEVYRAQCDYYGMPASRDVIVHIEDIALSGSRALHLDGITGVERDSEYHNIKSLTPAQFKSFACLNLLWSFSFIIFLATLSVLSQLQLHYAITLILLLWFFMKKAAKKLLQS